VESRVIKKGKKLSFLQRGTREIEKETRRREEKLKLGGRCSRKSKHGGEISFITTGGKRKCRKRAVSILRKNKEI